MWCSASHEQRVELFTPQHSVRKRCRRLAAHSSVSLKGKIQVRSNLITAMGVNACAEQMWHWQTKGMPRNKMAWKALGKRTPCVRPQIGTLPRRYCERGFHGMERVRAGKASRLAPLTTFHAPTPTAVSAR